MKKKVRKITKFMNRMRDKLVIVIGVFMLCFLVVIVNMTRHSVGKGEQYEKQVLSQQKYDSITLPYQRGDIVDCKNTVLATSTKVYNLILEPKNIIADKEEKEATINALVTYFSLDRETVENYLKDEKSLYKVVLKGLSYEEIEPFNEFLTTKEGAKVVGIWFEEEYERYYPYESLACHVLGFTTRGNVGLGGVEQYYSDELNGIDGRSYGYLTSDLTLERTVIEPTNGNTVVLTLDANLESMVEEKIAEFEHEVGAKNTSVLIMNPNNGEILVMANSNKYNLNDPYANEAIYSVLDTKVPGEVNEVTEEEKAAFDAQIEAMTEEERLEILNSKVWRNFAVSDTYEPGSTFKAVTMSAALEEGVLTGNETYYCDGGEVIAGKNIRCAKREGHGELTLGYGIAYSCNDLLMAVANQMGRDLFAKYQTVFCFGQKTNIDLPGEAVTAGLVYTAENLNEVELATSSFGQSLNCSMIQMACAYSSIINGGNYYEPHIVKQILDSNGKVVKNITPVLVKKTISESTSEMMRSYLELTVTDGTGWRIQTEGYEIGGKTGTAQKVPYTEERYLVSFIGFVPVDNPQFLIYVVVDEPNVSNQGKSYDALILTKSILDEILPYMNVYQTQDAEEEPLPGVDEELAEEGVDEGGFFDDDVANSVTSDSGAQNTDTQDSNAQDTDTQDSNAQNTDMQDSVSQ